MLKVHPFERLRVADCGDVDVVPISIERTLRGHRGADRRGHRGGRAAAVRRRRSLGDAAASCARSRAGTGRSAVVHFDAHPDTWDEYFGSKFFHGTPFRRAVEEGLIDPERMIQVGIRGPLYGPEDFAFHDEHGHRGAAHRADQGAGAGVGGGALGAAARRAASTARSTSTPSIRPTRRRRARRRSAGSRRARRSRWCARWRAPTLVGADVVEVSPPYDGPGQITSLLAANLVFELAERPGARAMRRRSARCCVLGGRARSRCCRLAAPAAPRAGGDDPDRRA